MKFDLTNIRLEMNPDEFFDHRKKWICRLNGDSDLFYKPKNSPNYLINDPNWIPNSGKLELLSDWIKIDHCWLKTVINGNPEEVSDRRIFIEKTPRIHDPSFGLIPEDWRSWIEGYKGHADEDNGEGPDLESIKWAEEFAKFIGYRL